MHSSRFATAVDLVPEAILLLGAIVCCGLAALRRASSMRDYQAVSVISVGAAGLSSLVYLRGMPLQGYQAFGGGLVVDRYSVFLIVVLCSFALFTVLAGDAVELSIAPHAGEYHALLLTATLGAILLASAREMVALYIALELLSVSLYVLVAVVKTDRRGSEAAFKYLILGAASSAILLYGLALLYGLGGATDLVEIGKNIGHTTPASALALTLIVAGLTFKLGAVPFHQWVPDVYQGAPAPVAGMIATMSKTAGFAALARIVVFALPAQHSNWTAVVAVVAVVTMVVGNLIALAQTDIRRLLGYSSIGQAGFILMGLLADRTDQQGIDAMLFYLATYGVTVVGAFAVVGHLELHGVGPSLSGYRGLSRRAPGSAAVLALCMVSLIGIPPLIGFFAKLLVFQTAVFAGFGWLVLLALVMTAVSAFYYLRVVKSAYVDEPAAGAAPLPRPRLGLGATIAVCGLAVVFLGAAVQPLYSLATGGGGQLH